MASLSGRLFVGGIGGNDPLVDVFEGFGVYMADKSLAALVQMPPVKASSVATADWYEEDGIDADLSGMALDSRSVNIRFHARRGVSPIPSRYFVNYLASRVYIRFYVVSLQMEWRLRYVSCGEFSTSDMFDSFTLTFAEDEPTIQHTGPTASLSEQTGYALDGLNLAAFGCRDVKGTLSSFHKLAGVKSNLSTSTAHADGVRYDSDETHSPKSKKFPDVTLNIHIRTGTVYDFWHNYHALFYALTRKNEDGESLRTLADSIVTLSCYYKSSRVGNFVLLDDGGAWCDFTVTLAVLGAEVSEDEWQYLSAEDYAAVVTEGGAPEFVIVEPLVPEDDGSQTPSAGGARAVRISDLPAIAATAEAAEGLVTIGVDGNGRSVKVPLTQLINALIGGGSIGEITAGMVSYNETYPTVEAALDTLLYVAPSISSFSTGLSTQEVGASVSSVTFTWAFNKTMSTISITPDVGTVTGTRHVYTPDTPITSTKTFTLRASDGRNTATKTTTITFSPRMFWLVSDQEVIGPDELLNGSASSALVSNRATTRTFNCSGGKYIYFCIPKSLCSGIRFVVNGLTTTFIMTQMDDFVNSKGANVPMNIYRSMNLLNGSSITVKVE